MYFFFFSSPLFVLPRGLSLVTFYITNSTVVSIASTNVFLSFPFLGSSLPMFLLGLALTHDQPASLLLSSPLFSSARSHAWLSLENTFNFFFLNARHFLWRPPRGQRETLLDLSDDISVRVRDITLPFGCTRHDTTDRHRHSRTAELQKTLVLLLFFSHASSLSLLLVESETATNKSIP